jgi:hypothetical protein
VVLPGAIVGVDLDPSATVCLESGPSKIQVIHIALTPDCIEKEVA